MKQEWKSKAPIAGLALMLATQAASANGEAGFHDQMCPKPALQQCPVAQETEVAVDHCRFVPPSARIDVPDRSYCLAQGTSGEEYRLPYRALREGESHWIVRHWERRLALHADGCYRWTCLPKASWRD